MRTDIFRVPTFEETLKELKKSTEDVKNLNAKIKREKNPKRKKRLRQKLWSSTLPKMAC